MLYKSAVALSQMTSEEEMARGSVFPSLVNIRKCSLQVRCLLSMSCRVGPSAMLPSAMCLSHSPHELRPGVRASNSSHGYAPIPTLAGGHCVRSARH
eukprot:scaffold277613_cov31-Tisochrysis_lutea.AAC.5